MSPRLDAGRVGRDHAEIDFIPAGTDLVLDHDAVVQIETGGRSAGRRGSTRQARV